MYASLEVNGHDLATKGDDSLIKIDSNIQSLSWTSKSSLTQVTANAAHRHNEDETRFQKFLYYQEGWLAVGNANSMVGCTYTSTLSEQQRELIRQREEKSIRSRSWCLNSQEITSVDASTTTTNANAETPSVLVPPTLPPPPPPPSNPAANTQAATTQTSNNVNINLNRTNFNLRGHKSDIKLVRWNEVNKYIFILDIEYHI